jgi:Bifunctional DNA primase/polymerase, N-terminal/AAA domain/Homeodomain-like domain
MLVEHALALAKRGLKVFPLKPRDKVPLTEHGFKDATTDTAQIKAWWERWPEANIGISTGEGSGFWTIDVDANDGGEASLKRLTDAHGPLPPTVESITGEGRHLHLRWVDGIGCTTKRLGPGLDTRGNGGYVVAPPSVHPSGRRYVWSVDSAKEFAETPDWLVELLTTESRKTNGANGHDGAATPAPDDKRMRAYAEAALTSEADALRKTAKGGRNQHLFEAACKLGRYAHHGVLTAGEIENALLEACQANRFIEEHGQRAYEATMASGFRKAEGDDLPVLEDRAQSRANGHSTGKAHDQAGEENACSNRLRPLDLAELLSLDLKPREMVLKPILPEKGLGMVYAMRGIGKTFVALGIAHAVSTGGKFLRWNAPKPRKVLHIDGEMPTHTLQERLAQIIAGPSGAKPEPGMLRIVAGDLLDCGIGNLAAEDVQAEVEKHLDGVDLLILDNLSSLTAVIRDNDAESWGPIQDWLLKLRRRGIAVLIIHHAGKGGQQRGTSRREDVLDTSISLCRPGDYNATEGARFEVHFEKARGIIGDDAKSFEARLEVRDGVTIWTIRDRDDAEAERVRALLADGLSVREIAEETGIPKSTVGRIKKRLELY